MTSDDNSWVARFEGALEIFVALARLLERGGAGRLASYAPQQRVARKIRIAEKALLNAAVERANGRLFIAERRICLSEFVGYLSIANAALFDLSFGSLQRFNPFARVACDGLPERLTDL